MVFWRIVAAEFVRDVDLAEPLSVVIGAIADLTVTSILGAAFLHFLKWAGTSHLWLKGAGFGLAVWVALFGLLIGGKAVDVLALTPVNIMVTPIAHFLFGLALAFFTRLLIGAGRPSFSAHKH